MKHSLGLSAFILCFGLALIPLSAQTGSSSGSASSQNQASKSRSIQSRASSLSPADEHFVQNALQAGKAEVELGKLAVEKGASPRVRQFGQKMVDDHSKINYQLEQLAGLKGVTVPDKLSSRDQAAKTGLEQLSGKQFDRAYMRNMVNDHTQDVSDFRIESKAARDPDVGKFAKNTLPTLRDHLKMAKQIAPK